MSSFWQFFDIQVAIFRRVKFLVPPYLLVHHLVKSVIVDATAVVNVDAVYVVVYVHDRPPVVRRINEKTQRLIRRLHQFISNFPVVASISSPSLRNLGTHQRW